MPDEVCNLNANQTVKMDQRKAAQRWIDEFDLLLASHDAYVVAYHAQRHYALLNSLARLFARTDSGS